MKVSLFYCFLVTALMIAFTASCQAAATLQQQIDQSEVTVGDAVTLTITVQNGEIDKIDMPTIDGLQVVGTNKAYQMTVDNGVMSSTVSIGTQMQTIRAGSFTIPSLAVDLKDGTVLHTQPVKIHVLADTTAPSSTVPTTTQPVNVPQQPFNPNGPVVMPNNNGPPPDTSTAATVNVPMDADGQPLKVFMIVTPATTDAYVGQAIPVRIEFYIRVDVAAEQNSIPTIDGSDFMMNPIMRPNQQDKPTLLGQSYYRDTWITAISAPKSGDFPMTMERDTYWIKSLKNKKMDFFGNFYISSSDLAHEPIGSNSLTFHIHPLPQDGRPANFSGAIGHLKATGSADPLSVSVGEPVTVHFTVSGDGNFTYIRCPNLASSPDWKSYTSSSKTQYADLANIEGTKTFQQSVIPQKNGVLQLPPASFSYFDPTTKQYVTTQVTLPSITVTGTVAAATPPPVATPDANDAPVPDASALSPNRTNLGLLNTTLLPAYHEPWFWAVQGSLLSALCLSGIFTFMRRRTIPDIEDAARVQRQQSLHAEEDAMGQAARQDDAQTFFLAARHAVQLQLGAQWNIQSEALTLGEIRRRDPQLAEALEPLFTQTDEVIYSGGTTGKLDLAQWERHVRSLLQSQLQTA